MNRIHLYRKWKTCSDQKLDSQVASSHTHIHTHTHRLDLRSVPPVAAWLGYCCLIIIYRRSKYTQTPSPLVDYFRPTMHSICRSADRYKFTHPVRSEMIPVNPHNRMSLMRSAWLCLTSVKGKHIYLQLQHWKGSCKWIIAEVFAKNLTLSNWSTEGWCICHDFLLFL